MGRSVKRLIDRRFWMASVTLMRASYWIARRRRRRARRRAPGRRQWGARLLRVDARADDVGVLARSHLSHVRALASGLVLTRPVPVEVEPRAALLHGRVDLLAHDG